MGDSLTHGSSMRGPRAKCIIGRGSNTNHVTRTPLPSMVRPQASVSNYLPFAHHPPNSRNPAVSAWVHHPKPRSQGAELRRTVPCKGPTHATSSSSAHDEQTPRFARARQQCSVQVKHGAHSHDAGSSWLFEESPCRPAGRAGGYT